MPNIYRAYFSKNDIKNYNKPKKKKKTFKELKHNTINSLNEIEYFLTNIKYYSKHIKIYKSIKNNFKNG